MNIGAKLQDHRKQRELTQEQVAQHLHVTRATISSWETGRTFPDIEKLIMLSELYDLSLDQLIREEPQIMKNISQQQKKLKNYRLLKIILAVLGVIVVVYSSIWLILMLPKNNHLGKWQAVGDRFSIEKSCYTIEGRKQNFPILPAGGKIPLLVTTETLVGNNKLSLYFQGKDNILITIQENGKSQDFKTDHTLSLKEIGGLSIKKANELAPATVKISRERFTNHQDELQKMIKFAVPYWEEIND